MNKRTLMDIQNPNYVIPKDVNIFNIRQIDYDNILINVANILKPIFELGFDIIELDIKSSKNSIGELYRTLKNNLVIKLQKDIHLVDLTMAIPKLIDGNYFIINGRKKIPLFQLFDIPIITRDDIIKFRSNVCTIMSVEEKTPPYIHMSFLGKKVPLALLSIAYFGIEQCIKRFNLEKINTKNDTIFNKYISDLKTYCEELKDTDESSIFKMIGEYYTRYNIQNKGEEIIYALDLILKVDPITATFLNTDSVINELIYIMEFGGYDDTNFRNKRIRFIEYVILSKISKAVFDFCLLARNTKKPKFNINSTQILSECNVSDIIQFDFCINPIDKLTKLSRTSLVGPGGFKRINVPEHLRGITDSMFGRICPVDTPDRDNCGVLQNLVIGSKFDDNLRFSEDKSREPISIPVSMTPFCANDDQTRLQMSSSQMRQAIMLQTFEEPIVQSGCENLYTDKTNFIKIAKKDGEVIHINREWIFVRYNDDSLDIFDIAYKKIYVQNLDMFTTYVKKGDKFKRNDILAESNFCKNGKITIGKNLLTGVMEYYGYNYEDGIVISDRLVKEDVLTSIHYIDLSFTIPSNKVLLTLNENKYQPLPEIRKWINSGDIYAKIKKIPDNMMDFSSLFEETNNLIAKKKIFITEYSLYANEWNEEIPEYKKWVEDTLKEQNKKSKELQELIVENFPKEKANEIIKDENLDLICNHGKFKDKGERINGIRIDMFGVYVRKISIGDKIGNRHGNKGVISNIVPHEQMPKLPDGRHLDICINPLGIIGRMNIGQLFELHMGMSVMDLRKQLLILFNENTEQDIMKQYIFNYIEILDCTRDKWYLKQFKEKYPNEIDEEFINNFTVIQPPFESTTYENIEKALEYTNTSFDYEMYEPLAKEMILNKIAVGYQYFIKMVHIAENRLAARGLGTYARKTLQPLAGRKNKGGQRCGEMETACLIAHDAIKNLNECFTTKSDCIDLKNKYIRQEIGSENLKDIEKDDPVPESVKLLESNLTVIGITKETNQDDK